MPTVTTNLYRQESAGGNVSLSGDSFNVSLMDSYVSATDTSALKHVNYWSEVSANEVSGATYSAMALSADTLSANSSDVVYWDGVNLTWTGVTVSPYGLAIYRPSDNLVVGFVEFDNAPIVAVNGSITISWNPAGIMNIFG